MLKNEYFHASRRWRTLLGVVVVFLGTSLSLSVLAERGDEEPSYKHKKKKKHEHCHSHTHSHDDHRGRYRHRHYHCHEHKHKHRGDHAHEEFNSREHRHAPHSHAHSQDHSQDHHDHHDRRRNHEDEQGHHDNRRPAPIDRSYNEPDRRSGEQGYAPQGLQHSEYISNGRCNRPKAGGRIAGAVIGGLIGSQLGKGKGKKVATVVGVLAGFQVGRNMDKADQVCSGQALEHARNNERTVWDNPDNGTRYTVTPVRTYQDHGNYCREYTTESYINGRPEIVRGNACRQPDGSWAAAH